jgi:hypothetical protein
MKAITIRQLKRGHPEDSLQPGESLAIRKGRGKTFELRRLDPKPPSRLALIREVHREIPDPGAKGPKLDVAKWLREMRDAL